MRGPAAAWAPAGAAASQTTHETVIRTRRTAATREGGTTEINTEPESDERLALRLVLSCALSGS
jgi:hypothetical protein